MIRNCAISLAQILCAWKFNWIQFLAYEWRPALRYEKRLLKALLLRKREGKKEKTKHLLLHDTSACKCTTLLFFRNILFIFNQRDDTAQGVCTFGKQNGI